MTQDMRLAVSGDVPRVKAVTDAAYHHYIDRIGLVPAPMEADHAADVAAGRVFVAGDPVVGLVVLRT
ncbi:GNAT family N-acetyltransferase, partial [Streptomyces sp. NPDC059810]